MSKLPDEPKMLAAVPTVKGDSIEVDLQEFVEGGRAHNRTGTWTGDFEGRPTLAREFRLYLETNPVTPSSLTKRITAVRNLFRFLDDSSDLPHVASVADLTEIHGLRLKRWVADKGIKTPHTYQDLRTIVQGCRETLRLDPLIWPTRDPDPVPDVIEPDYRGIQLLSLALRREARDIKGMFCEGHRLASTGQDPRTASSPRDGWSRSANHAWLVNHVTADRLLLKEELEHLGALALTYADDLNGRPVPGPAYLAPSMSPRGSEGYVGKLRWFYPSFFDTAVFLWIFLLHTGWNLSTALALDSSSDDWFEPHPQHSDLVIVRAWKARSRRYQYATGIRNAEFHPFKLIKYMIAVTERLRATLKFELDQLLANHQKHPSPKRQRQIDSLREGLKSPWLFHSLQKGGKVGWITSRSSPILNKFVRNAADRHSLTEQHPYLATLSTSQIRDGWINYAYQKTGQTVTAQTAAGHVNQNSLRYYLSVRKYRLTSEKTFRIFQNHVFSEINARRLDPTRLHILMQNGEITPEQEARLQDLRNRTRWNMGCLDPFHPPKSIAPDHISGELCRVQRCTGCHHGVAFDEALEPLAAALADIHHEKKTRPLNSWIGSSLEEEERSIAATLRLFDQDAVNAAFKRRVDELAAGLGSAFDVYPLYKRRS